MGLVSNQDVDINLHAASDLFLVVEGMNVRSLCEGKCEAMLQETCPETTLPIFGGEGRSFHQSNLPLLRRNLRAGARSTSTDTPAGTQDMFWSSKWRHLFSKLSASFVYVKTLKKLHFH